MDTIKKDNFFLNEDCAITGTIVGSCVSNAEFLEGRPKPVYSVTIKPTHQGTCFSVGLLYVSSLGANVANMEDIEKSLMNADDLTFDTINKPLVSGVSDSGEFEVGTKVRVSCRFEVTDGDLSADGNGQFKFPRFVLRFVDADWAEEENKPEPIAPISDEVMALYDF